jgi:hypothetical protein
MCSDKLAISCRQFGLQMVRGCGFSTGRSLLVCRVPPPSAAVQQLRVPRAGGHWPSLSRKRSLDCDHLDIDYDRIMIPILTGYQCLHSGRQGPSKISLASDAEQIKARTGSKAEYSGRSLQHCRLDSRSDSDDDGAEELVENCADDYEGEAYLHKRTARHPPEHHDPARDPLLLARRSNAR